MSMQPELWSISGLSVELGIDRPPWPKTLPRFGPMLRKSRPESP